MEKEKVIDGLFELYTFEGLSREEQEVVKEAIKLLVKGDKAVTTPLFNQLLTNGTVTSDTVGKPYTAKF